MAITYRDITLKNAEKLEKKQDKRNAFRAVITDDLGNQSGTGSIWADQNARRIWVMPIGGVQPFQIICVKITPVIGLGVICGYSDDFSTLLEVLRTDYEFLGPSNTTGTAYESPSNLDFLPGGRLQLWIDGRMIQPLATYPDPTGLLVNVVDGEYIYGGVRVTFDGEEGIDLTSSVPATPGQHRYVGLYLDSANTLQTVDGTAVSTANTAPEPTWPAGAFELSMVLLANGQTDIDMGDVVNKRILSTDITSFSAGGGWPFDNVLTVSTTNTNAGYTTLAAAITAADSSGDTIELDSEIYSLSAQQTIGKSLTIIGQGPEQTILDFDLTNNACIDFTADNITVIFRDLTIDHSAGAGTLAGALFTNNTGVTVILDNAIVKKSGGSPGTGYGAWWLAGSLELRNGSKLLCTSGTAQYGFLNDSSGDVTLTIGPGCEVGGGTADVYSNRAGSILNVTDCTFTNGYTDWAGDVNGQYHGTKLVTNSSGATAPGRDIGYINADGDYVTTTTANYFGGNCVVVVSGGNGLKCFVATAGRWPMRYTGSAPSDGDFLVTSTTAGAAGAQTTMRPEIFARCQAAGSGNVVTALLLAGRVFVPYSSANRVLRIDNHSSTDFSALINGSPTTTNVPYDTVSGNENSIAPLNTTELGKIVLHNTTDGNSRYITATNTGTNNITTLTSTDGWADNEAIQANSLTCLSGSSPYFFDIDLSQQTEIPELATALALTAFHSDSAGLSFVVLHPFETFSTPKQKTSFNYDTTTGSYREMVIGLIQRRFCFRASAAGSGTAISQLTIDGYWIASS